MKKAVVIAAAALSVVLVGGLAAAGRIAAQVSGDLADAAGSLAHIEQDVKDSQAFYHATMPRIIGDPSADYIATLWSSRERTHLDKGAFDAFIARRTKLGAVENCDAVFSTMRHNYEAQEGLLHHSQRTDVSAKYSELCHFANGSAVIRWSLEKEAGGWAYTALEVADAATPPVAP